MSIFKKLPAVLIAAVGISLGFAGAALAETIFLVEKILGPQESVDFVPRDTGRNITLCFRTDDKYNSGTKAILKLIYVIDDGELDPSDSRVEDLEANAKEQCISRTVGDYLVSVYYSHGTYRFGPSVYLRATQE